MSKICENCGNMIPDGKNICPACGREEYNDAAIQAVLEELALALDGTEPVAEMPAMTDSMGDTIKFDKEEIRQASAQEAKKESEERKASEPKKEAGRIVNEFEEAMTDMEEAQVPLVEQPAMKLPTTEAGEEKPAERKKPVQSHKKKSSGKGKKSGKSTKSGKSRKGGKKRKKKKRNTAITIIIVILILLLLALGGACIMALNTMGFFDSASGDELLVPSEELVVDIPSVEPAEDAAVISVEEPEEVASAQEKVEDGILVPEIEGMETPDESGEVECTKFSVTGASDLTLNARGETSEVVYVIQPEAAKSAIQWESSDPTIASVDANGVILGRRGGYCTITGTCGDHSVKINVTCNFTVPATVLDMNFLDITMDHEGQTVDLFIDYDLDEEQIAKTVWESSDSAVASVDTNGTVTAVADGTAVISASIANYTASCIVRCVGVTGNKGFNNPNSEYAINYEDVTLTRKGEYFQLSLKSVLSSELADAKWSSSSTRVATVDSKGVVTAVANGTAEITTTIGEDQFRCIVRVNITGE